MRLAEAVLAVALVALAHQSAEVEHPVVVSQEYRMWALSLAQAETIFSEWL